MPNEYPGARSASCKSTNPRFVMAIRRLAPQTGGTFNASIQDFSSSPTFNTKMSRSVQDMRRFAMGILNEDGSSKEVKGGQSGSSDADELSVKGAGGKYRAGWKERGERRRSRSSG
jgi:hypothetical protein